MTATRARRALRALSTVLIAAGAIILTDAALTVVWQEPTTALLAKLRQDGLRSDLRELERAGPTPLELKALAGLRDDRRRLAFLARSLRRRTEPGDAVARLRIPAIGVDKVVVKGSAPEDLRKGPGFYDEVALPGVPGTTAIAGHRTTYGAPFRRLDDVDRGDRVVLELPYGRFTYRVERTRIVDPSALWVLRRKRYDRLVLSACHPLFSAAQRIVVFARLERVEPTRSDTPWTSVGALRSTPQATTTGAR
ncbi:MAG: class E sortase [Solirubrobacterales bacterium]|nr:class E sortase [Solirubrobacterales bacterium]